MFRLKRNPEKFEVIDLFTALGRVNGYKLGVEEDADDFIKRVSKSLQSSFKNDRLKHGKRVEALFAQVAGALGNCQIIKQEDSGNIFLNNSDIEIPDYSLVLKDGTRLFVEVKNCNHTNHRSYYGLSKDYVAKLEKYARLNGAPLKFAIYFSRFNKWILISKDLLIEQHNRYVIDFVYGTARNEMSILDDRMIAAFPPITVEFLADQELEPKIDENNQAHFTVSDVKLYCKDEEILDPIEKNIAFYLVRFGSWDEVDAVAVMDGDKFRAARFVYEPEHPHYENNQEWCSIGDLSSMISTAYNEHTVYERSVIALDTDSDPDVFSVEIPDGYKGDKLPLIQGRWLPNPDFKA